MKRLVIALSVASVVLAMGLVPANATPTAFPSCAALTKAYPNGIVSSAKAQAKAERMGYGRLPIRTSVYKQSQRLDKDRDGVMCPSRRTVTEAYRPPSTPSAPVSACQLKDQSYERRNWPDTGLAAGFPTPSEPLKQSGVLRMALIPIDWATLPGEPEPLSRVRDQMQLVADWYDMVSDSRMKVDWVAYDGWVRMPGAPADYTFQDFSNYGDIPKFGADAIAAADPAFDFTNVDVVNLILPKGQRIVLQGGQVFPSSLTGYYPGGYVTQEGRIGSFTVPGAYFDHPMTAYWSYWAHESGHFLGIAHVGTSRTWDDMHGYDLMGSQDGPFRTLNSWLRFVKRWLNDDQVYCQPVDSLAPTAVMLTPLDSRASGVKSVIVPTSATSAVVVESRRPTRFDNKKMPIPSTGVLVYTYDATKGSQEDNWLKPIYPAGRPTYPTAFERIAPITDALLKVGDSVTVQGVKVTVRSSGQYDTIDLQRG